MQQQMLPYRKTCSFKHKYKRKKENNGHFHLKRKNPALEAKDKVHTAPACGQNSTHSVFCVKYRMQLPLTQPCNVLINCQKQPTGLQNQRAQKTFQSKLIFSRTA